MDLQPVTNIALIIQALFSTVTGLATVAVLYLTYRLSEKNQELIKQSKQADILGEYNARFSRTLEMRANPNIVNERIFFYERFWNLQFDQFISWRQGFIPDDVFRYWMECRYDEWLRNHKLGAMFHMDGFQETVGKWHHCEFKTFMNLLHTEGVDKAIASFPRAADR